MISVPAYEHNNTVPPTTHPKCFPETTPLNILYTAIAHGAHKNFVSHHFAFYPTGDLGSSIDRIVYMFTYFMSARVVGLKV